MSARAYKGKALEGQMPQPTFAVLLGNLESAVREEQMEKLPEYRAELRKHVAKLRVKVLEAYHKARLARSRTPTARSPYDLMQERLRKRPWALLVGCILFNKASSEKALPVLQNLLADWPTHDVLADSLYERRGSVVVDLLRRFQPLGFQVRRARFVVELTEYWEAVDAMGEHSLVTSDLDVTKLPGCGRYAAESFEIFVRGRLIHRPEDKELRRYVNWARARAGRGHS